MLETGVGRSYNIALASTKLIDYPGDTSPNERYFSRDLVKNPFQMRDGRIEPNPGPGTGIDMDDGFLKAVTSESGLLSG
jgi:O-succinylbenzoate synthase